MQALIHRQLFEFINMSGTADRCPISVCVAFVISRYVRHAPSSRAGASSKAVSQLAEMTAADNAAAAITTIAVTAAVHALARARSCDDKSLRRAR